jgi:hypothetical protein
MKLSCDVCGLMLEARDQAEYDIVQRLHKLTACPGHKPAAAAPPAEEGWKEKSASFMSFDDPGEEVTGILEAIDYITMHDKEVGRARVRTDSGVRSFLFTAQLEPLLVDIPPMTVIRVRYLGEVKSTKGRTVKQFAVWTKEGKP